MDKVDRAVEQRTQALEEKRSWAVTGRAGRDTIGRVYDEEDPGGAGDPTIPDYVMRDYEGIRDRYRNEQEDTVTRRTAGRAQGLAYWLIARNGHGRIEVLTLDGKKTLPVFSYEGEAEMFLQLKGAAGRCGA